jgi:UDP-N-acetylglucosamine--N-acetylmuramyl-(pentapeptide) pyrophosphoryl-undecaprenol N-acetylglucosamine transferase
MKKVTYIALVAARSGGHIIPGITLATKYCLEHPDTHILYFSTRHTLDKKIMYEYGAQVTNITLPLDNVPKRWYLYPLFIFQCMRSFFTSLYHLIRLRPVGVILMGGYISIPVACAATLLRIPRHLYELNAVPGSATKFLAPIATTIHVCFETARKFFNIKKTELCAYPVRFDPRKHTQHTIDFDTTRMTCLVLGGSQGSFFLNTAVMRCLKENPALQIRVNIIHQTGACLESNCAAEYKAMGIPAIVFDYKNNLEEYYQAADIVIGRSGAGTIFETLYFKKPCILIPLEIAGNDHQVHNAQAIAQQYPDIYTVIRQHELSTDTRTLSNVLMHHTKIRTALSLGSPETTSPVNSSI